ncbi:MAG: isoprenylcysteine carboxylmethyltransferase family protein [Candidatus Helarchaeota archaeon]|nr:isoprenylcysteine carboxylmethyltransferase family protein [Candidatus Helarchaeota archaeon]
MHETNESLVTKEKLGKSGIRYIIRSLVYVILHTVIIFIAAGTINLPRVWILFSMNFGSTLVNMILLYKFNVELLNRRGKMQEGTKSWDKIILAIWLILLFILDIIAGLDVGRFHWTYLNFNFAIIGIILWLIAAILATWAEIVNTHFEATVRIQKDKEHQVITKGPYKFVRHPGYVAVILVHVAVPLILGSILTFIPTCFIIGLFILRTYLEDKTLQTELTGYSEYTQKTKYRLLPGIW